MHFILSTLAAIGALSTATSAAESYCTGTCTTTAGKETCKFTAKVDLYAGELGYYTFEECGAATNPTLGMKVGTTYQFVQKDVSNYYHPLGFSYYADGAHADLDELEPGVKPPGTTSTCAATKTCPAPMYHMGENYMGFYSNNADLNPVTSLNNPPGFSAGQYEDFGLDVIEPLFFRPLLEWANIPTFSVYLKFDDAAFTQDIFYFCHIHQYMTGRIKILKASDGLPVSPTSHLPKIDYAYDVPDKFDAECGTYGLNTFQLPNGKNDECPKSFLCNVPSNTGVKKFSECLDAMNCAMMVGMTTNVQDELSLFIHQMIPHHQNAVNMAKALLKTGKLVCPVITAETPDCALEVILRSIIASQNAQIQVMRGILEKKKYPQTNDCKVSMGGSARERQLKFLPEPEHKFLR